MPHRCSLRVRYAETDQGGIAYHANYLLWFEVGRTEMLRELGFPYSRVERDKGLILAVVEASVRYVQPARYDDLLWVETAVSAVKGVRLRLDTTIFRDGEPVPLCSGSLWLAAVGPSGRPVPLPPDLRQALEGVLDHREDRDGIRRL